MGAMLPNISMMLTRLAGVNSETQLQVRLGFILQPNLLQV